MAGWPQVMEIMEVMELSWNFFSSGISHGISDFYPKVMEKSWSFYKADRLIFFSQYIFVILLTSFILLKPISCILHCLFKGFFDRIK